MRFGPVAAVCAAVLYSAAVSGQSSRNSSTLGIAATNQSLNSSAVESSEPRFDVLAARFVEPPLGFQRAKGGAPQCKTGGELPKRSIERPQGSASDSDEDTVQRIQELLKSGAPPLLGSSDAPVTIVVFGDFECSFCKRMNDLLEGQFVPMHRADVNIVYRYFPLPQHPWAKAAAQMAECAKSQDEAVFWKLGDFLYSNQDSFSAALLRSRVTAFLATDSHTNLDVFAACVDDAKTAALVDKDIQLGTELGVHSTPTLFVNGQQLHGVHELPQLEAAVKSALDAMKSTERGAEKGKL
jgi:protein-disulfide isomerase